MAGIGKSDLEGRLHMAEVDGGELVNLLAQFFPRGSYTTELEVELASDFAKLTVVYDKRTGQICGLVPGEGFSEELVAQLEKEVNDKLRAAPVPRVARFVLYAHMPVVGYWRYRDRIVLRQVAAGAPQPPHASADHPLICEIRFDGASDPWVNTLRSRRVPRQLALLLTLLVPGLGLPEEQSQSWILTPTLSALNPEEPTPEMQSEYAQQLYFVPGMLQGPDHLSEQGGLPDVPLGPVPDGIVANAKLTLREDIVMYLDMYHHLTSDDRRKLLRAAYWLHLSRRFENSFSASFQSLVQAVEVLTIVPTGQPKCPGCQRDLGVGPTKLFHDFVTKYAPSPESREDERLRKQVYKKRSQLTHGNVLLNVDEETGFVLPSPARIAEHRLHDTTAQVCRGAVLGWLRSRAQ